MKLDFTGRVALLTGAGRGIGRATALAFADAGADVAVVATSQNAESVAAEVRAKGRKALGFIADAADYTRAQEIGREVVQRLGRIDILFCNAGISQPARFLDLTEEQWDRTMAVNLKGHFNYAKAVAATMLAQKYGRIIAMSSMSAKLGGLHAVSKTAYVATKAGILGFTRGLARELAPHVTVNAVCPGVIETEMTGSITVSASRAEILKATPLGRLGTPEDVAAAVLFLASDQAGFITAEMVDINGGNIHRLGDLVCEQAGKPPSLLDGRGFFAPRSPGPGAAIPCAKPLRRAACRRRDPVDLR